MCVQYVRVLNINIESIVYCICIMYFIHDSLHIVQKPITFKVCAYKNILCLNLFEVT